MQAIECDTRVARKRLLLERDAMEVRPNPKSSELWRIRMNDCFAIAYQGKVLPQGRNQQRISDILIELVQVQGSLF